MFGCCKKKNLTDASARVVDGKLILSLPAAQTPVVWQMDLAHAKASALEVQHHANDDTYGLHLKTPKGDKVDVAVFKTREDALKGLMAASGALESAHGAIRPGEAAPSEGVTSHRTPPVSNSTKKSRAGFIILGLIILIILFTFWSAQLPVPVGGNAPIEPNNATAPSNSGVPMSADAYLNSR